MPSSAPRLLHLCIRIFYTKQLIRNGRLNFSKVKKQPCRNLFRMLRIVVARTQKCFDIVQKKEQCLVLHLQTYRCKLLCLVAGYLRLYLLFPCVANNSFFVNGMCSFM